VANGVNRLSEIASVPYLDVAATMSLDGKTLTLFCVNRSLTADIPASMRLHDLSAVKTATVHTLSASNLADGNDEVFPTRVKPMDSVEVVQPEGWTHVFPHASVTVIALHRSK
jgi:alpha-N-arabinofuranosidase